MEELMASASESQLGQIVGGWGDAISGLQVLIVSYAFSVIGAIFILIVGWTISRLMGRWVRSLLKRTHRIDPTVVGFSRSLSAIPCLWWWSSWC